MSGRRAIGGRNATPTRAPDPTARGDPAIGQPGAAPRLTIHSDSVGVAIPVDAPATTRRRAEFLPFAVPHVGDDEIAAVADALRSGWISTGPRTHRFEAEFAARLGAPAALAVNSGTAALHTALIALGIGPGDEVITTPMTFCASVNVIEHVGATPVLVDIESDTLNIDPVQVAAALTPRTRAVLAVHFAGHPAELDALHELTSAHGIALIEDAAHAVPARYRGRPIGSGSNPAAFSFYATKNVTTGEGGMLTGSSELLGRARVTSLHGMSRDAWLRYAKGGSWEYEVLEPGFKYNMTDLQAALGLVQLARLDDMQRRRRAIVAAYQAAFGGHPALILPVERSHVEHAWHLYVLRLVPDALRIDRRAFIEELQVRNIGTSVHFIPIHLHPFYRHKYGFTPGQFPLAYETYRAMLSLPLHPGLSDCDVRDVIEAVLDVAGAFRR